MIRRVIYGSILLAIIVGVAYNFLWQDSKPHWPNGFDPKVEFASLGLPEGSSSKGSEIQSASCTSGTWSGPFAYETIAAGGNLDQVIAFYEKQGALNLYERTPESSPQELNMRKSFNNESVSLTVVQAENSTTDYQVSLFVPSRGKCR